MVLTVGRPLKGSPYSNKLLHNAYGVVATHMQHLRIIRILQKKHMYVDEYASTIYSFTSYCTYTNILIPLSYIKAYSFCPFFKFEIS